MDNTHHRMLTFVLVHGAWHGGWCWKKLTPLLRAAGHQVYAPSLTGMGDRSHLLAPWIDLDTHIKDITSLLEYEDLHGVALVGHSYGGMVIAGVAEQATARLAQVVYLDAFLPEDGKCLQDYHREPFRDRAIDGWRVPVRPGSYFGVTDERDIAWMKARLGDQPLRTFMQPVRLSPGKCGALKQAYIACSASLRALAETVERAKRAGLRYRELPTAAHDVMITQPEELAGILLEPVV
jgi:pimeloyl-ACP methyl ester carboxylesterase